MNTYPNPAVVAAIYARVEEWQKEIANDQVRGVALKMRGLKRFTTKGTKGHKVNSKVNKVQA
jgi:hypothetical protein